MTIALKLEIMDLEAELASAPPRERPAIQKRLDGHRAALADAQERGSASRAASRVAARAAVVTVEPDADDEDLAAPDSPPSAEAVRAVVDRAMLNYAGTVNGKPIKVSDLSAFQRSMQMRAGVQRTADAVRVRADIASRSSGRGSR